MTFTIYQKSYQPSYEEKLTKFSREPLSPQQKQRLDQILSSEIKLGLFKIHLNELLDYLQKHLNGIKRIALKGGIVISILDQKKLPKDVDIYFEAEDWADLYSLEKSIKEFLKTKKIQYKFHTSTGEGYCNLQLGSLDISFSKDLGGESSRSIHDCREIDLQNLEILYPNSSTYQDLLDRLQKKEIGCSLEKLENHSKRTVCYFIDLFIQGCLGNEDFCEALFKKLVEQYQDNEKSFESWFKNQIQDYFNKHIPENQILARLVFLTDLALLASWILQSKQEKALSALWKALFFHIQNIKSQLPLGSSFCRDFVEHLDESIDSLKSSHKDLLCLLYFYCPFNTDSSFFQIQMEGKKISILAPQSKDGLPSCEKREVLFQLVPKISFTFKEAMQSSWLKQIGISTKKELVIKLPGKSQDEKLEAACSLLPQCLKVKADLFKTYKWPKGLSTNELFSQWKELLQQWSQGLVEQERSCYLHALSKIIAIGFALDSEHKTLQELLNLYYSMLADEILQSKEKAFTTHSLPFLSAKHMLSGILFELTAWVDGKSILRCLKALPLNTEADEKAIQSLKWLFPIILTELNREDTEEVLLLLRIIKIIQREVKEGAYTIEEQKECSSLTMKRYQDQKLWILKMSGCIYNWMKVMNVKDQEHWFSLKEMLQFLCRAFVPNKEEGIHVWQAAYSYSLKHQNYQGALSCIDQMRSLNWISKDDCRNLCFQIFDQQGKLSLQQWSALEMHMQCLLSQKYSNLSDLIKCLKYWNKITLKESVNIVDSDKYFLKIIKLLSLNKDITPQEAIIVLEWMISCKAIIKIHLQLSFEEPFKARKAAKQLLLLINKIQDLQPFLDFQTFKKCSEILKTIAESEIGKSFVENNIALIFSLLIKKWLISTKTPIFNELKETALIVTSWPFGKETLKKVDVGIAVAEILFTFGMAAIPECLGIYEALENPFSILPTRGKKLIIQTAILCVSHGFATSLHKLFLKCCKQKLFEDVLFDKEKLTFISKTIDFVTSNNRSIEDIKIVNSISFQFVKEISEQDACGLILKFLQKEETFLLALEWLERKKILQPELLGMICTKLVSHPLYERVLSYLLIELKSKKLDASLLGFLLNKALLSNWKQSSISLMLIKELLIACESFKKEELEKLGKLALECTSKKIYLPLEKLIKSLLLVNGSIDLIKQLFGSLQNEETHLLSNDYASMLLSQKILSVKDVNFFDRSILLSLNRDLLWKVIECVKEDVVKNYLPHASLGTMALYILCVEKKESLESIMKGELLHVCIKRLKQNALEHVYWKIVHAICDGNWNEKCLENPLDELAELIYKIPFKEILECVKEIAFVKFIYSLSLYRESSKDFLAETLDVACNEIIIKATSHDPFLKTIEEIVLETKKSDSVLVYKLLQKKQEFNLKHINNHLLLETLEHKDQKAVVQMLFAHYQSISKNLSITSFLTALTICSENSDAEILANEQSDLFYDGLDVFLGESTCIEDYELFINYMLKSLDFPEYFRSFLKLIQSYKLVETNAKAIFNLLNEYEFSFVSQFIPEIKQELLVFAMAVPESEYTWSYLFENFSLEDTKTNVLLSSFVDKMLRYVLQKGSSGNFSTQIFQQMELIKNWIDQKKLIDEAIVLSLQEFSTLQCLNDTCKFPFESLVKFTKESMMTKEDGIFTTCDYLSDYLDKVFRSGHWNLGKETKNKILIGICQLYRYLGKNFDLSNKKVALDLQILICEMISKHIQSFDNYSSDLLHECLHIFPINNRSKIASELIKMVCTYVIQSQKLIDINLCQATILLYFQEALKKDSTSFSFFVESAQRLSVAYLECQNIEKLTLGISQIYNLSEKLLQACSNVDQLCMVIRFIQISFGGIIDASLQLILNIEETDETVSPHMMDMIIFKKDTQDNLPNTTLEIFKLLQSIKAFYISLDNFLKNLKIREHYKKPLFITEGSIFRLSFFLWDKATEKVKKEQGLEVQREWNWLLENKKVTSEGTFFSMANWIFLHSRNLSKAKEMINKIHFEKNDLLGSVLRNFRIFLIVNFLSPEKECRNFAMTILLNFYKENKIKDEDWVHPIAYTLISLATHVRCQNNEAFGNVLDLIELIFSDFIKNPIFKHEVIETVICEISHRKENLKMQEVRYDHLLRLMTLLSFDMPLALNLDMSSFLEKHGKRLSLPFEWASRYDKLLIKSLMNSKISIENKDKLFIILKDNHYFSNLDFVEKSFNQLQKK